MCIRAFDYMPPVDVTFGDFLRAMITADFELVPDDEFNLRDAMIEAFRLRGIYPEGVNSLAEESLLWDNVENQLPVLSGDVPTLLEQVFFNAVRSFDTGWQDPSYQPDTVDPTKQYVNEDDGEEIELDVNTELGMALHQYAMSNKDQLGLNGDLKVQVRGFHPVFRVAPNGRLLVELVVQYAQVDHSVKNQLGGIPFRGGCTLIASSNGKVRYLISKPMRKAGGDPSRGSKGEARFARQQDYLKMCDLQNALTPYYTLKEYPQRMLELMNFANLHGG
jgi:hypothetical protein